MNGFLQAQVVRKAADSYRQVPHRKLYFKKWH